MMAPQIGTVRDGFVIDLDDAIGNAARNWGTDLAFEFDDPSAVAVDTQFGGAGEHAVTLDPLDDLLAHRHIYRDHPGAAVRRATNQHLLAIPAGIHACLHVMR